MTRQAATSPTVGDKAGGNQRRVERLLTRPQGVHARAVLDYVAAHSPHPEAEVRLAMLMLTLRAARAGTGNVTGQDLTGWLQDDAERVLGRLVTGGWLRLPGTVAEVMASRPEDPVEVTVPTLLPEQPRPFTFGKTTRARISGWAQKVVGDRKIRKKKLGVATRLLALYTAATPYASTASGSHRTSRPRPRRSQLVVPPGRLPVGRGMIGSLSCALSADLSLAVGDWGSSKCGTRGWCRRR
ncbi:MULTISPECIES: hypothetical protein [Streptomyces violaceusniger group]|uniref:Uncharacterized protein n=2 Tax=Streptomyces rhizosphaericus TaxID=114699 RepID=A0ABP4BBH9_9ACTN|nr:MULTISPECIES: hypothetical protein [Streptomyces violaceusniger group]